MSRPTATVRGYSEEGLTTTPCDMLLGNDASRIQLAIEAIRRAGRADMRDGARAIDRYRLRLEEHHAFRAANGQDPDEITAWRRSSRLERDRPLAD